MVTRVCFVRLGAHDRPNRALRGRLAAGALGAAVLAALAFGAHGAQAQANGATAAPADAPYQTGSIRIERPWMLAAPAEARAAPAYLTIVNAGARPDRIVATSSILARSVRLDGPATLGAAATATLAPGGESLVLVNPTRAFAVGEKVPVTLVFARAGRVTAEFDVLAAPPIADPPAH